jgi:N-acyl amino acid synthase FeeM
MTNGGFMSSATGDSPTSFSDRVLRFLERVEHRIARTDFERESAFQLRYDAYVRNDLLEPRADRRIFDEHYDIAHDAWITLTFLDGQLAATTRLNLGIGEKSLLPSMAVYPDVVTPKLRAGFSILETTRLAANLGISGSNPELAYVAMRPGFMAATHFDIDFAVASPRLEHMAFYRRVLLFSQWCEPRPYPGLSAKFGCMGADFSASRERIEARYPFFKSDSTERETLFGPSKGRSDRSGSADSAVGLVRSA